MKKAALLYAVFLSGALNIMFFIAIASQIGGDAVSGGRVEGHYYLSNHGMRTEVSEGVFDYSLIHLVSLVLTTPAAFVAGAFLVPIIIEIFNGKGKT